MCIHIYACVRIYIHIYIHVYTHMFTYTYTSIYNKESRVMTSSEYNEPVFIPGQLH